MKSEVYSKSELINELRKQGKSYGQIGAIMGISKQRVHQLYKGYLGRNSGTKIVERTMCTFCHSEDNLEVHHINGDRHNNDRKNLLVLCRKCHKKLEATLRNTGKRPRYDRIIKQPTNRAELTKRIMVRYRRGYSMREIGEIFNVSRTTVWNIINSEKPLDKRQ